MYVQLSEMIRIIVLAKKWYGMKCFKHKADMQIKVEQFTIATQCI